MRSEIEAQIQYDHDVRLETWIHLDWARAYQMLGQIEECIKEGRAFYRRALAMQSPHAIGQVKKLLKPIEKNRYGNSQVVKAFREELEMAGGMHT